MENEPRGFLRRKALLPEQQGLMEFRFLLVCELILVFIGSDFWISRIQTGYALIDGL